MFRVARDRDDVAPTTDLAAILRKDRNAWNWTELKDRVGHYLNDGSSAVELSCIATRTAGKLALTLELSGLSDLTWPRQLQIDIPASLFEGVRDVPALTVVLATRCTRAQLDVLRTHVMQTYGPLFESITVTSEPRARRS